MGRRTKAEIEDDVRDTCNKKFCRNNHSDIIYFGVGLCTVCWHRVCELDYESVPRVLTPLAREILKAARAEFLAQG